MKKVNVGSFQLGENWVFYIVEEEWECECEWKGKEKGQRMTLVCQERMQIRLNKSLRIRLKISNIDMNGNRSIIGVAKE